MKRTLMLLSFALPLYCQSFSFGIKGGVPLTDALNVFSAETTATKHWTIGPTVELSLPANFSVGVDALYRGYSFSSFYTNSSTGQWEFPVYLRYHFGSHLLRPFVEAGVAFDRAYTSGSNYNCVTNICAAASTLPFDSAQWGVGALVGGGVEVKVLFLKIAPEVRYTRWQKGAFSSSNMASGGIAKVAIYSPPPTGQPNQAEVLVGIRF